MLQAIPVLRRLRAIRKRGTEREAARDPARLARPAPAKRDKSEEPGKRRPPDRPLELRWPLLAGVAQGGFKGYGHWRKKLKEAQEACGVDLDAQDLRHICASVLWVSDATMAQIQNQMAPTARPPLSGYTRTSSPSTAASWSACPGFRSRPPRPPRRRCRRTRTGEAEMSPPGADLRESVGNGRAQNRRIGSS
jgi:hypothetical protein